MTVAVYPGSFNPWHEGHSDILFKAGQVFDKIIIARGVNPEKPDPAEELDKQMKLLHKVLDTGIKPEFVEVRYFEGFLADFAYEVQADAIIRGLRNGNDLEYEKSQQYWNEDLGLAIPFVYFICDRKNSHISSSMIRAVERIKNAR